MFFLQLALAGVLALASAASNETNESRQILPSTFYPPNVFQITNLVRNINLERSYPRETVNAVIENIDLQPQSEYYVPFEQGTLSRIGAFEARNKKDAEAAPFASEIVEIDPYR